MQILKERQVRSEKIKERAKVSILIRYKETYIFKVYVLLRQGLLKNQIVQLSNIRFDKRGLIIKLLLEEEANISIPIRTRGGEAEN